MSLLLRGPWARPLKALALAAPALLFVGFHAAAVNKSSLTAPESLAVAGGAVFLLGLVLLGLTSRRRLAIAALVGVAWARHLQLVGIPGLRSSPTPGQIQSLLSGALSDRHAGLPVSALVALVSLIAVSLALAEALNPAHTQLHAPPQAGGARPRRLGLVIPLIFLVLGQSALLGYATGSPLPFLP